MFNDLSPWSILLIVLALVFLFRKWWKSIRKIKSNNLVKTQKEKEPENNTQGMSGMKYTVIGGFILGFCLLTMGPFGVIPFFLFYSIIEGN